jgi:hypothetical protein
MEAVSGKSATGVGQENNSQVSQRASKREREGAGQAEAR